MLENRLPVVLVWLSTVACTAVAGCTSTSPANPGAPKSDSTSPNARASSSAPALSVAEKAGQEATAAYLAMWSDFVVAGATSDWQLPRLAEHAVGDALTTLTRAMYTDHQNGVVTKGEPKNDPSVSSVTAPNKPTTVMISDCGDSTRWLKYNATTGALADDTPGGRRAITAEVKLTQDGTWKVSRFAVEGLGSC